MRDDQPVHHAARIRGSGWVPSRRRAIAGPAAGTAGPAPPRRGRLNRPRYSTVRCACAPARCRASRIVSSVTGSRKASRAEAPAMRCHSTARRSMA